jgi:hypothetical protein
MRKFKVIVGTAAIVGCAISSIVPITASASTQYYGKSESFASSYTYTDRKFEKTDLNGTPYDAAVMGQLQGTNNCSTKFSTSTGDFKTVYVCEWNSSGTAKSYLNDQHEYNQYGEEIRPANKFANINASFFTPTHTYHEGYTTQADSYLCYWLN